MNYFYISPNPVFFNLFFSQGTLKNIFSLEAPQSKA